MACNIHLCLGHIHRPTEFIGRHLGVFCILLSNHHRKNCRCGWCGTYDLDDRPSSADNPKTVCRDDGVKLRPSIGMLSADVCQASVGDTDIDWWWADVSTPMSVDCRRMLRGHRHIVCMKSDEWRYRQNVRIHVYIYIYPETCFERLWMPCPFPLRARPTP
jgi:hypothetical protein